MPQPVCHSCPYHSALRVWTPNLNRALRAGLRALSVSVVLLASACGPSAPASPVAPTSVPTPVPEGTAAPPRAPIPTAVAAAEPGFSADDQARLAEVRQLLVQGDAAQAAERLHQLSPTSPPAQTDVRFQLALALAAAGQGTEAQQVLATPPPTPDPRDAFARGQALEASGQHAEAMAALTSYATSGDASAILTASSVWLEMAEAELRARRPREAAEATAHGLDAQAAQARPLKQQLLEVRAQALAALGDTEQAFDAHRQVLALATSQAALGEQLFRLAQASRDLGKRDEAIRALQTALEQFPNASTTADALRLLDDLGAADQIDPYVLGRARYSAGDVRNAVAAFDRSLAAEPDGPDAPSARLYRALASLTPGNEPNALRDLDAIAADPTQDSDIAAQAMLEAGQALETLNLLEQAESRYQQLLQGFPRLDAAATASFRLGLSRYVRGAYAEAVSAWDTLLGRRDDLSSDQVSQALYWRGKALDRQGQTAEAHAAWQQAAAVTPAGYYTLRAADVLGQLGGAPAASPSIDAAEEAQLASWFADRHLDLAGAANAVGGDPALLRAREDASLDLFREGNWEADELVQRYVDRADRLYWLSRRFAELGLTAGATRLGQAAYDAAGVQTPAEAPLALRKAAFPRPFAELGDQTAARYGLDPLLLAASFQHATRFDPWAADPVSGARGVALMSPIHAEEAAHALHAPAAATTHDAIEQDAWLLADRLRRFDGRPEVALAAISTTERQVDGFLARPGADDPDVFIERIDFPATRADLEGLLATRLQYAMTYGGSATDPLARVSVKPEPTAAWIKIARFNGDLPPAAPIEPAPDVGTPEQQAEFARGATLQRDGDPRAVDLFRQLADAADPAVSSAARLRLGEALLAAGRPAEALEPLASLGPNAEFLTGRALRQLGRCPDALPHFQSFVSATSGPLVAQGQAALADCLADLGRLDDAIAQLTQASQTPDLPRLEVLDLRERLAVVRARAGDVDGARADYERLLAGARTTSYRAELNYYLGVLAPDPSGAASRFRTALQTDPRGHAAQAALDELVALGDPAASSFEAGEARFEQSRYREALAAYSAVAAQPDVSDAQAARAVYGRGVSLVRLGQDRAGIDVLEQMAQRFPGTPDAADGLFRGGRIRESLADLDGAAASYAAVTALPGGGGARGLDAQFRLAFVQFRQGRFAQAADGWRGLAARATQPDARSQALFWLGKALAASGDEPAARAAWTRATTAAPTTYYALRAADLLGSADAPRADVDRTTPIVERHAEDNLSPEMGARVSADPAFGRAQQLLALGLRREAIWELDDLAGRLGETAALAQLGAWEQSRGLYYPALVLGLSLHVNRLMYPLPHPVALAEAARQQHVDPLLFAALILQESNMDQSVESAAQARGLSQLIASTAYEAARALGRYDFQASQLFQPQTSMTLGAYTFARRLARYDQQIFPALAAYNASAYAVDGWLLAANTTDIDTFAEAIPFTETYPYVQRIYENYRQYLDLYGPRANP